MPLPGQTGPPAGTELAPRPEQAQALYLRYGWAGLRRALGEEVRKTGSPLFFLGPQSHDYLPQEREGEDGLSLQVEPEWRNEL